MHWSRSVRVKVFKFKLVLKTDHHTGVTVFFIGVCSGGWTRKGALVSGCSTSSCGKTFFLPFESVNARRQRDALSHSGGKIFVCLFVSFFGLEDPSQSPD